MNIDTLIQTLESAAELATDGECHASIADHGADVWLGVGVEWMVGPNGAEMLINEAQAIAIRHNTAAQVISELKTQRARADRAEDQLRSIAISEVDEEDFHTRNTCLLCDEYVSDVPSSDIVHKPDCLLYTPPEATP